MIRNYSSYVKYADHLSVEGPGRVVGSIVADARRKDEAIPTAERDRITLATPAAGVRARSPRSPEAGHVA